MAKEGYGRVSKAPVKHSPGEAAGDSNLGSAVDELHKQHPIDYCDHGPHHGTGGGQIRNWSTVKTTKG